MAMRQCTKCNQNIVQGYCIEGGLAYYCSDNCLYQHYSKAEWNDMYNNGKSDSYWTEWEINKITYEEAKERFINDQEVYLLFNDGTEGVAEHMDDIICHEGICGEFSMEC